LGISKMWIQSINSSARSTRWKITPLPSVDLTLLCLTFEVSSDPADTFKYRLHRICKKKPHISFGKKITLFPSVDLTL
jgi:hypothetical protein